MKLILISVLSVLSFESKAYFTRDEVLKSLRESSEKVFMDEPLDKEALIRKSHLIPDKIFLKGISSVNKSFMGNITERIKDLPLSIDWRSRDSAVKKQDDGKCTAFSLTSAVENIFNRDNLDPSRELSATDLWHWYQQYSSVAAVAALSKNRIASEQDYPQYGQPKKGINRYLKLAKYTYVDDDVNALLNSLAAGNVGVVAMATPNAMLTCPKSGVISRTTTAAGGGHAIAIVGYYLDNEKNPILILKNSWGADCSDHGYQYLPVSICKNKGFYCSFWSIESVDVTPSDPQPNPSPMPKPQPRPEPLPVPVPRYKTICERVWYKFFVGKSCHEVLIEG